MKDLGFGKTRCRIVIEIANYQLTFTSSVFDEQAYLLNKESFHSRFQIALEYLELNGRFMSRHFDLFYSRAIL